MTVTTETTGDEEVMFISYKDWHSRPPALRPDDADQWIPEEHKTDRLEIEPRIVGFVSPNWPQHIR